MPKTRGAECDPLAIFLRSVSADATGVNLHQQFARADLRHGKLFTRTSFTPR